MKSATIRLVITGIALLAALWALLPTYKAYQLDSERNDVLKGGNKAALAKWDSLHGKNYREAQKNFLAPPIKLGLDLQGGMYVTMEVDIPALLAETAQHEAVDDLFQRTIDSTRAEAALSDAPVLDIFMSNFDKIARPAGRTLLSYFDAGATGGDINEERIKERLAKNIEDAVGQAEEVIRQRIDKFGVSEISIQKIAGRRLVLELPGITDAESVRSLLQTTARLEFKLVKNDADAIEMFRRIDKVLAGKVTPEPAGKSGAKHDSTGASKADSTKKTDSTKKADSTKKTTETAKKGDSTKKDLAHNTGRKDSTKKGDSTRADSTKKDSSGKGGKGADTSNDPYKGMTDEEKGKAYRRDHPFTINFYTGYQEDPDKPSQDASTIYAVNDTPKGEYFFSTTRANIDTLKRYLQRPEVRALIPEDRVIAFSAHPEHDQSGDPEKGIYGIYVLTADNELTGEVVSDAFASFDQQTGKPEVIMDMNGDGADRWADITGKNVHKRVAIVLDSAVYSAPTVQTRIDGGRSSISGSTDIKEANLLAIVLKAGALKAPVKIIEERIVGPSLGSDSISQGFHATWIAAAMVILFMFVYYRFGGFVADVAVMLNVIITLAALAALGATLTLPGIGGLVLTIGMAVDGNILIYERIREEMARGKALKSAVLLGYEKAFAAIIDTHITTFMTGAILYVFGSGPVRGFAATLMIGIAATLFTAVFVTKTVFLVMLDRGATNINYGQVTEEAA
ncbi:MAG: protein translocase subunit SecD [Bacteroidetes bacterium]|nr:protein translocase subunit SecD [Bacteroidota bacterium]